MKCVTIWWTHIFCLRTLPSLNANHESLETNQWNSGRSPLFYPTNNDEQSIAMHNAKSHKVNLFSFPLGQCRLGRHLMWRFLRIDRESALLVNSVRFRNEYSIHSSGNSNDWSGSLSVNCKLSLHSPKRLTQCALATWSPITFKCTIKKRAEMSKIRIRFVSTKL